MHKCNYGVNADHTENTIKKELYLKSITFSIPMH